MNRLPMMDLGDGFEIHERAHLYRHPGDAKDGKYYRVVSWDHGRTFALPLWGDTEAEVMADEAAQAAKSELQAGMQKLGVET